MGGGGGGGDRLILHKAFICGGQIRGEWEGEGSPSGPPIAFSGPNTKRETPSGLMHFYRELR